MRDPSPAARRQLGPILCAGTVLLYSALFALTFHAMVDDAYISFRYADHWADGVGLRFNRAGPPVEGYSNFLWVALLAAQRAALGWTTPSAALALLYLAGAGTLVLLYRAGPRLGLEGPWLRTLPALLLAVNPAYVGLAHMGLETILYAALVTAALLRWLDERAGGRAPLAWLGFLAAALTRPEGFTVGCYAFAVEALVPRAGGRAGRRWWLVSGLGFVAPLVAYHLWRHGYYGQWLPNPFYAKVPLGRGETVRRGLRYAAGFLLTHDGLYHTVTPLRLGFKWLLLLPAGYALLRRPSRTTLPLAGYALLYTGFIIVVGGDWMSYHRFFGHILPLLMILAAQGFAAMSATRAPVVAQEAGLTNSSVPTNFRRRLLVTVAVVLVLAGQIGEGYARDAPTGTNWAADVPALLRAPRAEIPAAWHRLRTQPHLGRTYARWLARTYPPDSLVTADAVGLVPYYTPFDYIDTLGLVDRQVAQDIHAGDPAAAARAVLDRAPDLIGNDVFARGGLRQTLGITTVDRLMLESETYARWYTLDHVVAVQVPGAQPPTVVYLLVSVRRAEPRPAPGVPFRAQFDAYLADPGPVKWTVADAVGTGDA